MHNYQVGQLITHSDLSRPRNIRRISFNSSGEMLIGIGKKSMHWLIAKDCKPYQKKVM